MSRRLAFNCARTLKLPLAGLLLAGTAMPALAGEAVLYDTAPGWIELAKVEPKPAHSNSFIVLFDQQARFEKGRLWSYIDTAIALD